MRACHRANTRFPSEILPNNSNFCNFLYFFKKKFGDLKKVCTFAIPNEKNGITNAEIAQLVEHNLAKVRVASSSLVFRSRQVIFG